MDSPEIHLVLLIVFKELDSKNAKSSLSHLMFAVSVYNWNTHCIGFVVNAQSVVIHVLSNMCYICFS